jgi:hypothetical protein
MSDGPIIRALDALIQDYPPKLRGRQPYWHPTPPAMVKGARVPRWELWKRDGYDDIPADDLLHLDVNGAWMAPVSGTELAHGELEHTGPKSFDKLPGYWLIDVHHWSDPTIVSPLGTRQHKSTEWFTTPTITQLLELQELGEWPDFKIYDSWTCPDRCRLSGWAAWVRELRAEAQQDREDDPDYYDAVKLGFTQAITMFLPPAEGNTVKSKVLRPDWFHTLNAAQAANTWRKARWMSQRGIPIAAMHSVDEVTIWAEDYYALEDLIARDPKAKMKLDQSGVQLGHFKIKSGEPKLPTGSPA